MGVTLTRHCLAILLTAVAAAAPGGTIVGSVHDFHASGYTGSDICVVCHTPHQAAGDVAAPLWNRTANPRAFQLYRSERAPAGGRPNGPSKLCLSCHDGTVAVDSFGGVAQADYGTSSNGAFLGKDHPVSLVYDGALASRDTGLHDPGAMVVTVGEGDDAMTGTIRDVMLFAGELQCSSCHDVHDTFTVDGPAGDPLLKVSIHGSNLCLTCHRK